MPTSRFHPDDTRQLPTVRMTMEPGHGASARCEGCGTVASLNLPALVKAGREEIPLIELPLRCAGCGGR